MSDDLMMIAKGLVRYDEEEGALYWLSRPVWLFKDARSCGVWNARFAGKRCGSISRVSGYRSMNVFANSIYEHRLIFFIHHGRQCGITDHINGVRSDNRIFNLREVDDEGNQRNKALDRRNTSGVSGVYKNKRTGNWYAHIHNGNRPICLGTYLTFEDAVAARKSAEENLGYHAGHGRKRIEYNVMSGRVA